MKQIMLSQLIGLISATWETNNIIADTSAHQWSTMFKSKGLPSEGGTYALNDRPSITLRWKNKNIHCGPPDQYICITFDEAAVPDARMYIRNPEAHGHIYYYFGDNCNDYTMFLYSFMGSKTDVIDDLGLIGYAERNPGRKSVCGLSAHQYLSDTVNGRNEAYNRLVGKQA